MSYIKRQNDRFIRFDININKYCIERVTRDWFIVWIGKVIFITDGLKCHVDLIEHEKPIHVADRLHLSADFLYVVFLALYQFPTTTQSILSILLHKDLHYTTYGNEMDY